MSPEELKANARRFADELLTQGDLAVARELFSQDCRHHAPEPVAPGDSGIASWAAELRHAFPDLRAIVEDEIAEGNMVALRLSLGGTQEGQFGDIAPSGHRANWQLITIFHANPDGRFVELWSSWDRLGLVAQFGARSNAEDGARAPPLNPTSVPAMTDPFPMHHEGDQTMHRRAILRAAGASAALALGYSRFGGAPAYARQATDLAGLGLPELTITVTETGYQVSPQMTPAGWTLVTFENQGPGDNSADVMLLPPGETMESLMAALSAAMESPTAAPPAWIYETTFAGAPWARAGSSAQGVVLLSAGDWVLFSPAPLTPATLTVTGENATPVVPSGLQADREVRMQEYAFLGLDDSVPAGPQVWQVTNTGHQPHFITFSELPAGTSQAQFMDGVMAMMSGTPEAGGPDAGAPSILGGCSTLSGGQSLYLALDLAAGTYGAICFFPEQETGAPHAMLGMDQVFTVS